jgi:hypothetical protein
MDRCVPLPQAVEPEDFSSDDCATIQAEPRKLLSELGLGGLGGLEEDRTMRVDLSGLARRSEVGGMPEGLLHEAPTRRLSSARAVRRLAAPVSGPPAAESVSGVRITDASIPAPEGRPLDVASHSRNAIAPGALSAVAVEQDATQIVRTHRPGAGVLVSRVLGGITLFALGFSCATLLWIYLERHPQWRARIIDGVSSVWPTYFAKPER